MSLAPQKGVEASAASNKRIAINTLLLYLRMLFIMLVELYTSRVVLNILGVVDYGIYNVVGGIVTMFTFLNGAMVISTQRYLSFELGRGNMDRLREVFTTSIHIHFIISIVIILLAETIGLWFLFEKMIIPEERMTAAFWVFQLSIVTMVISVMSVPYNSIIVAYEKMSAFAIISVFEVLLKLFVVFLLFLASFDKLIAYAALIACVQMLIRLIYTRYSRKHFEATKLLHKVNFPLLKEMGKFAGWNVLGNMAAMLFGTGLNMLLNVFFGPVVNAARGIAVQVESNLVKFSTNFLMAVNPQITKLYSQGNLSEMHTLLFRACKFTCFLLFALSLPILIETREILSIWLKIVPDYTVEFLRVLLPIMIIDGVARPLMTAAAATGDVKRYQIVIGGILLSIVPIAYVVLRLGGNPVSVYVVYLLVVVVSFVARLFIVRPMIKLSLLSFSKIVIFRSFVVCVLSFISAFAVKRIAPSGIWSTVMVCIFSILIVLVFAYFIGLSRGERTFVNSKCGALYKKVFKR